MREWERAYEAHPTLASQQPWPHVCEVLAAYPGSAVYEVGFGSGRNLLWALENGWQTAAGCEVAETAMVIARALLPGADLRKESIVDCSAPSETYDTVIDRAALSSLSPKELKKAIAQIRRILKPNGIFYFNPYGVEHTKRYPEHVPAQTKWDLVATRRLFPNTKLESLETLQTIHRYRGDLAGEIEHTLRITVRKLAPPVKTVSR